MIAQNDLSEQYECVLLRSMYKADNVRLYVKPFCGWCVEVREWLEGNNICYQFFDVTSNRAAWDEMIKISNQRLAPVIDVDGKVLADFGAEELALFWTELS